MAARIQVTAVYEVRDRGRACAPQVDFVQWQFMNSLSLFVRIISTPSSSLSSQTDLTPGSINSTRNPPPAPALPTAQGWQRRMKRRGKARGRVGRRRWKVKLQGHKQQQLWQGQKRGREGKMGVAAVTASPRSCKCSHPAPQK